jgi:hypothetical protein
MSTRSRISEGHEYKGQDLKGKGQDLKRARIQGAGSQRGTSTRGRISKGHEYKGSKGHEYKGQDLKGTRIQGGMITKRRDYNN